MGWCPIRGDHMRKVTAAEVLKGRFASETPGHGFLCLEEDSVFPPACLLALCGVSCLKRSAICYSSASPEGVAAAVGQAWLRVAVHFILTEHLPDTDQRSALSTSSG